MTTVATAVLFVCAVIATGLLARTLVRTLPRTHAARLQEALPWRPRQTAARLRLSARACRGLSVACAAAGLAGVATAAVATAAGDQDAALTAAAAGAVAGLLLLGARAARRSADELAAGLDALVEDSHGATLALRAVVEHGGVDEPFEATARVLIAWAATTDVAIVRARPAVVAAQCIRTAAARVAHAVEPGLLDALHKPDGAHADAPAAD